MAPNGAGTHSEELKRLDAAIFINIAPIVDNFAKKHRLLIEKYYHDTSSWSLRFKRKDGGSGAIYILLIHPNVSVFSPESMAILSKLPPNIEFEVSAACWVNDYDTQMSHSIRETMGTFWSGADLANRLLDLLESALKKILGWKNSDLTEHSGPNQWKNSWKTKEEFEKANSSIFIDGDMKQLPVL